MLKIKDNHVEYNNELPGWWKPGQKVRIIDKKDNSFFIYRCENALTKHAIISDSNSLRLNTPDGWYDILIHSKVCVRVIFNRPLDVSPDENIPLDDLDPRTATEYDLHYWLFKLAKRNLVEGTVPRGFGEAVRTLRDSFHIMKLERKGISVREMETREIVVDDDGDDDES